MIPSFLSVLKSMLSMITLRCLCPKRYVTIISLPSMLLVAYVGVEILLSYFSACLLLHYVASLVWPLFVHWCFFTFVQTCLTKHSQCDLTLSLNSFKCSLVHLLLFDKWACFQQQPFVCYKLYKIFAYNQCRYLQAAHNDLEVIMVRPALITRNHKL